MEQQGEEAFRYESGTANNEDPLSRNYPYFAAVFHRPGYFRLINVNGKLGFHGAISLLFPNHPSLVPSPSQEHVAVLFPRQLTQVFF